MTGNICRMGSDLVGDQAFTHVFSVGKTQVFLGGDVTEHRRAMPSSHGRADGRRDVVITRGYVRDQRAEHIEGRLVALLHLFLHVELDLIERHMSGALHHHLNIVLPGTTGEIAQRVEFCKLSCIGSIVRAAGTQRISQGERAVVTLEDLADVIKSGVKRILTVVIEHPLSQDPAATADDAGDASLHLGQVLNQQTRVDGLVINALLAVLLDDVEKIVLIQLFNRTMDALQRLVHGNRADGHGRCINDRLAHLIEIHPTG